ncbi:MAG: hypothetical protein WC044_11180 [Crocinitomicaceae bacterium]
MRFFILLFFCGVYFFSSGQNDSMNKSKTLKYKMPSSELESKGLYKNFFDFSVFGLGVTQYVFYFDVPSNKPKRSYLHEKGFGTQFRFGKTWFLNPIKNRTFFRMTWLGFGLGFDDGLFVAFRPLHPSLGNNFRLNENVSVDLLVGGGLIILSTDWDLTYWEFVGAMTLESKININQFAVGIEYSRKTDSRFHQPWGDPVYNYLNLSFGVRF